MRSYILVRESGVRFDVQYSDKLFGVFQHLQDAEEFEGKGIGLCPGKGVAFYFSLPRLTENSD